MHLEKATVLRLLEHARSRISGAAVELSGTVEAENAALLVQRPALAATLAGELRCLRTITHNVINHMVARLK